MYTTSTTQILQNFDPEMYYQVKRISNTDLSIAKQIMTGEKRPFPEKAFRVGRFCHLAILEPEAYDPKQLCDDDRKTVEIVAETAQNSPIIQSLLYRYRKEWEVYWHDRRLGVPCKSKLDLVSKTKKVVADLKTTYCTTLSAFEDSIKDFEYDRQLAFYADSVGANEIAIIGISKTVKNRVFTFKANNYDSFIEKGRAKYTHILEKIVEKNLFEKIYTSRPPFD